MNSSDPPKRSKGPPKGAGWKDPISVCVIQNELVLGDVDRNLSSATELMEAGMEKGPVDLFVLPEVFASGFPYKDLRSASSRSDDVIETMSSSCRSMGSSAMFTQIVEEDGAFFNRCFCIAPDGEIIGTYDKTHLFSRSEEGKMFSPGAGLLTFGLKGALVSPLICYEVRFPELSRKLVLSGTQILVYMAEWPGYRIFQWDTLLRARAVENQCYVIGSSIAGAHGKVLMGGSSRVISPFGDILCSLGRKEGHARAELSPEDMRKVRENVPALRDRREGLYRGSGIP